MGFVLEFSGIQIPASQACRSTRPVEVKKKAQNMRLDSHLLRWFPDGTFECQTRRTRLTPGRSQSLGIFP